MKKSILLIFALFFFMMSCTNRNEASKNVKSHSASEGTFVEILYFHSDMRCKNCYAMEKGVSELLNDQFKEEVKDGKIIFKTIDITTPEGEQIADNYGVTWSSLYLNNWKDGKEERNDLTRMGMKTAAKDPAAFKEEVKHYINQYISAQ